VIGVVSDEGGAVGGNFIGDPAAARHGMIGSVSATESAFPSPPLRHR
jgi:hypothetical protein